MSHAARILIALCSIFSVLPVSAATLSGKVLDAGGAPIPNCFVALMNAGFAPVATANTAADGAFTLEATGKDGYLVVQPANQAGPEGLQVFRNHPRLYKYAGETSLELTLPAAATLVLDAFGPEGERMRWEDFEKLGKYGGQFAYATNLNDESIPMTAWPIHGEAITGMANGPREKGLPGIIVSPGESVAVSVMFWPTSGYGKLLLKADNGGAGYTVPNQGGALHLNLNVELARSAVAALANRISDYPEGQDRIAALGQQLGALPKDAPAAAKAADTLLVDALKLRDELEVARAKAQIPLVRRGALNVRLTGAADGSAAQYKVGVKQLKRDFLFGAYEGSPYNGKAYEAARKAGFDYATILPAWNWTQNPKTKAGDIDRTFGISALKKLGYRIKAHGVVWMQDYGILPDFAKKLSKDELPVQALEHQRALLDTLDEHIDLWEAMNEPANTNVPALPRESMMGILKDAAANIGALGKPALVNSPHEFSYGGKYWLYNVNGSPVDGYPETYSAFLDAAQKNGTLDGIQIIGLQCYPGFHLNADWANAQGPAYTPACLLDTLRQYTRFGRNIHITELSFPSTYGKDWFAGYWREPWTEQTQADYAEMVYTLAYAEPMVHSITWWDISDAKPSVISGGLMSKSGKPKPVMERLSAFMSTWNTPEAEAPINGEGQATLDLYGGEYEVTITGPGGFTHTETFHLLEGWQAELVVDAAG